jgi:sec-independent protein translocase protein TatC
LRLRTKRLDHDEEVTVVEHLDELRNRLIVSLACLAAAFMVAFWRHGDLIELLKRPLPKVNGHQLDLFVFGTGEQFKLAMSVSFWAAVIVALPILFYQLYAYVIPAFNPDRTHTTWPLLILVPSLFVVGVVFAYIVVLPAAASFLLNFDAHLYTVQPRANEWFEWCVTMFIAVGLIFELPAAVLFLTRLGIVNSGMLRKYRRYAIIVLAVVAAALPGVDPVSMIMEFLPLLVLYEFSIVLSRMAERRDDPAAAKGSREADLPLP